MPPTPTTHCLPRLRLEIQPKRPIDLSFDAPATSSDGGLLLLRQVDDRIGLTSRIASHFPDVRAAHRVVHSRAEQVRQRLFSIALGYEDQNDATALRHDPVLSLVCERRLEDRRGLSSQATLSRLEHAARARDVVALQRLLEADYVASLPADTRSVILDIDATADPTHGQQPLAFFHGHYGHHMYFPLLVFDHEGRLVSVRLRPGNAGNNRYATPLIVRVVRAIKTRFPHAQVVVRADSGFCKGELLDALEALDPTLGDVAYVLGLERNPRLLARIQDGLDDLAAFAPPNLAVRTFDSFMHSARSWSRERRIVAKLEHLGTKSNPRFVVTSVDHVPARMVYEQAYCARGDAENKTKDFKNALAGDRLSCTTYVANALRLLFHAFAYRLMFALRCAVADVSPVLSRMQFDTLRLRMLKVAAFVRTSVRRTTIALPRSFPFGHVFASACTRLGAAPISASAPGPA